MLDCLFALNGESNVVVLLEVDELLEGIPFREPTNQAVTMFTTAANKIAGDTDIERTVPAIRHDVNEATSHLSVMPGFMQGIHVFLSSLHFQKQGVDGRNKSGHDRLAPVTFLHLLYRKFHFFVPVQVLVGPAQVFRPPSP